jgi:nitroreductase
MNARQASPRIHQLIVDRWSPRSFDASEMPEEDLQAIFEAAGLAPSAYNVQPWKFLYSRRGDENWERFLSLLVSGNRSWAKDASVLLFIVSDMLSRRGEEPQFSHSHSFDAGAAWAMMALQVTALGYHAHGMVGVDFDRARKELQVPDDFRLEAAVAIGRRDVPERLPENLQAREAPSGRKPVREIAVPGNFR